MIAPSRNEINFVSRDTLDFKFLLHYTLQAYNKPKENYITNICILLLSPRDKAFQV